MGAMGTGVVPEAVQQVRTCQAPLVAMRFEPDGMVQACCVNSRYPLGNVEGSTIREIWESARMLDLVRALEGDDFSLGCEECGAPIVAGDRRATYAPTFDRYRPDPDRRWPRRLEFALSNRCNLLCIQCTGELSSSIRTQREGRPPLPKRYGEAFFAELDEFLEHCEHAVFLGGEPFLMPEATRIWDRFLAMEPARRPAVDVTTNGTVWNERVERYVRELAMTVAVSIDGATEGTAEAIRVGSRFDRVMSTVEALREVTRQTGGGFGLNCCIMRSNWHELLELLVLGDRLDASVEAILITYPRDLSLLLVDRAELDAVVAGLEARDAEARATLGRNLGVWDEVVRQLRAHRDGRVEVPVAIDTPRRSTDFMVPSHVAEILALVAEARAEQTHDAGAPLVIHGVDGVVAEVEVPPWAAELGPEAWVGTPVDDLSALIGGSLGGVPAVDIRPWRRDLIEATITVADVSLRALVGEWVLDGRYHLEALVAPSAP